ncbi:hypothetical protein LOD99_5529 [Oopsacas minuta]|uniref:Uncharacterized protein n=1 Tax=Oopsacas minuta TaxID=111878 RepID=A0AAV7JQA7_9METZ|nr:hypothetical protein LOD99_5529 [Oopsacas minuta]
MIWRESKNHFDDCYFCMNLLFDQSLIVVIYLVPIFIEFLGLYDDEDGANSGEVNDHDCEYDVDFQGPSSEPSLFHQAELNDLIRDLDLWKESSELLASRLKEKILLHQGTKDIQLNLKMSTINVKEIIEIINYSAHDWVICVDLKMVNFLLGQQAGFTKYPCFLCYWDSRDRNRHWIREKWPPRECLKVGDKNVINNPLVHTHKIILPPLHIKLGLMKQFIEALDKDRYCFKYIRNYFPGISEEKKKAGIFEGPQIRKLLRDNCFKDSMNEEEKRAWQAFSNVVYNFLGIKKASNYKELVTELVDSYHALGCNMSIKIHYLRDLLDRFPDNLGDMSEE